MKNLTLSTNWHSEVLCYDGDGSLKLGQADKEADVPPMLSPAFKIVQTLLALLAD